MDVVKADGRGGGREVTATQAEIDRDDIPLAMLQSNKRRRLDSSSDEELDYCLSGSSVIDPIAIEYWHTTPISSFGQTLSPALEAPSATLDVALLEQQQQTEGSPLVPLDGTPAIPEKSQVVTALDVAQPEPEVTPDVMAMPTEALVQEEEILIEIREGEVSWASEVTPDRQGPSRLIGVEIGIVEPDKTSPDPILIFDPVVCPLSPPEREMSPISSPALINTPVFYRPSFDEVESPPGSVASSTDFLPSPAS